MHHVTKSSCDLFVLTIYKIIKRIDNVTFVERLIIRQEVSQSSDAARQDQRKGGPVELLRPIGLLDRLGHAYI